MTIGQHRRSSDVWIHPNFFDTNYNIGAPPDFFSFHGQNWWYPAWNWDALKKDGYSWVRSQISHLEKYFQCIQFDHPLGLFRTWCIPANSSNPLLGHYSPSIPFATSIAC